MNVIFFSEGVKFDPRPNFTVTSNRGHPQPVGVKPPKNQTLVISMPPLERELLEDVVCDLDH